ncbi:prepilin-type N-terminal cleavage/methylation domain-containing protein [Cyanobium sp. Alchichica 3B3-8F6]|uniref:GspH/FimT family pseudopilin n=1 Tax=unclassified Cyanobium TaxID=2627006 RepID=UPI0020CC98B7|nr:MULTISPECIES: GspH/FimT family pseudopilin [unclassified Cyanobium]MCP9882739.1 prepilin-type N-terminal cleavage/methylation domain-containing protein [Cyanobium sp. Alchichica 3B3-8F6]MCP9941706.1 prepilin-type N-terminal cleavage/methylation domain-containing protein [Cyanobium sp. ATX 6E8]
MPRFDSRTAHAGFSLPEVLVAMAVLGILAAMSVGSGQRSLALMRVESTSRRLALGLEQARQAAARHGQPCALALGPSGWREPSGGSLPACGISDGAEQEHQAGVELRHNLPAALRFSSNGLVLDGGTVLIAAEGIELRRCLVLSLPLGVVRLGRYSGPADGTPSSSACLADGAL